MTPMSSEQPSGIWWCKIGECDSVLPSGSDLPMRQAIEAAYLELTGQEAEFTFSGWRHELTEPERAVVENRLPEHGDWETVAMQLAEAIRLTREYVGDAVLPAREGWAWFDALQEFEKVKGSSS